MSAENCQMEIRNNHDPSPITRKPLPYVVTLIIGIA
jgi:hypothetical protein